MSTLNPTPSPFAAFLNLVSKGEYDSARGTFTMKTQPPPAVANELGTVHGGYLQAAADEAMMLLMHCTYGRARAVTLSTEFRFLATVRPHTALTITSRSIGTAGDDTMLIVTITTDRGRVIADARSVWHIRKTTKAR